jgi:hypothetical protein
MNERSKPSELDWQHIESRYEDAGLMLFEKRIDKLRNPRNDKVFERLVLESVDWVNVVALDADGRSLMIRQYRFGVGYTTLETPGGMVDPGEDSKTACSSGVVGGDRLCQRSMALSRCGRTESSLS